MSQDEYFQFVKALAKDLNNNEIKLPSFPDVVLRIRTALDNADTTGRDLADILSNDAALASRILVLANSTYHNPAGIKIEGLDAAVGRIGFEKVRATAIAYAVEQLHAAKELAPLKSELRKTWVAGLQLAALSEVLARHCTNLDADSAFIAGLLNRIGVLYIFTKYTEYPSLLQDPKARQNLIDEWAAPIGESIVQNWKFSAEIQATLNPDEVETTRRRTEPNLADIIIAAKLSLNGGGQELKLQETRETQRLQLTPEQMPGIFGSYKEKLNSLFRRCQLSDPRYRHPLDWRDGDATPFTSREIRWFLGGSVDQHPRLRQWFENTTPFPISGDRLPPVWQGRLDDQADLYLLLPGQTDMGIKWREGLLQIKGRAENLGARPFGAHHQGQVERWIKWSYAELPDTYRNLFDSAANPDRTIIAVHKTRCLRLLEIGSNLTDVHEVSPTKTVGRGLAIELTAIDVGGLQFCSLGLEAFPDDAVVAAQFDNLADTFLETLNELHLTLADSASYPAWLQQASV